MTDAALVFTVLGLTVAAFASDRFRLDLVALIAMLSLALMGILTPGEALAGFAEPLTLMIAGLFVVGAGLFETGVADRLGDVLSRLAGGGSTRLLIATMLTSAVLSAFLSSTGTVAVLLPVVVALARNADMAPSRLLMPLAFGSLLGGMLTLIGTPPNLVVADQLRSVGQEPFSFFAFTPVGLVMLTVGVTYMATIGRRLLPSHPDVEEAGSGVQARSLAGLAKRYGVDTHLHEVEIPAGTMLAGTTMASADVRARFGVTVLAVESREGKDRFVRRAEPGTLMRAGDVLHILASREELDAFASAAAIRIVDEDRMPLPEPLMLIETILPPDSRYVDRKLVDSRLHDRTRATVVAVKRGSKRLHGNLGDVTLRAGDALLLAGGPAAHRRVATARTDLIVVGAPREWERFARDTRRAPAAIAVLLAMLVVMTLGVVPNAIAVLAAAVAMVVVGAVSMDGAYRAINWESVVLIAAILPMATALDVSGGLDLVVNGLVGALGQAGPLLVMAAPFVLTTASSTVYECLTVGTPIIAAVVAANQRRIATKLASDGVAIVLDAPVGDRDLRGAVRTMVTRPSVCERFVTRGADLVDGGGAARVVEKLQFP